MQLSFAFRAQAWDVPPTLWREAADLADAPLNALLDAELPRYGGLRWQHGGRNLVTDAGARWLIGRFVSGAASPAWYVLFKGTGSVAAGDTAAAHAAWSEEHAFYSQATRPALTIAVPGTGRSGSNAASLASVTVIAPVTLYGAGLISDAAKNGAGGLLYDVANYGASRSLTIGQIYRAQVSVTF